MHKSDGIFDSHHWEERVRKVAQLILNYLKENDDPQRKVVEYQKAVDLQQFLDLHIAPQGIDFETLLQEIEKYLKFSVRTGHKKFSNQLYSGLTWPALIGEVLATITNSSMSTYEVSPVGTLMEKALVKRMRDFVGYFQGEGIFLTGGSNANLVAMLCARNTLFPSIKEAGIFREGKVLTAFVSEEAHYSFHKAANGLGLGMKNLISVPADSLGRMIPEELDKKIRLSFDRVETPFFIGATAGTTVTASFDPLEDIAQVAQKYKLWLHVDGSYGGSFLLSSQHRHLLKGKELADSFTWDAHKLMGVPLVCSAILLKEKGTLLKSLSAGGGEYLFHEYENQEYDLGPLSLQCGRRIDALKLWLNWKTLGDEGHAKRLEKVMDLAKSAEDFVKNHPRLHLVLPRQSLNVCFRYQITPQNNLESENRANLEIRKKLVTRGQYMVNYSWWKNQVVLRAVFLNPELQHSDVVNLLEEVVRLGDECFP